ncbi:MAG: histidinol dehydrogenase [Thermoflexales bacterium]|nr:histidinol dehydrogenase [Thermoflexales bacterium]MCS7324732.1 histidinol dehydrogenase [Thermoflexales bacterium]MDW8053056.1 histidinol dehydrogenase [Anaerolineae bacterium]MDW8291709.1 histidinol dehydrogenase [Anaerolineae bacterium]
MLKIVSAESARETLLRRLPLDETPVSPRVQARLRETFGEPIAPDEAVRRILRDVRLRGDAALLAWTQHLDGVALAPNQLAVEDTEIAAAYDRVDAEVVGALERAAERIRAFHARPVAQSWMMTELGGVVGQVIRPLARVGVYVPAGSAPLPSSLLMTALVARAAGVPEVVVCSPPQRDTGRPHPLVLVAADIAEVDTVYAVGGAQAIGAMAYGTETVPRVDKICGPGNLFVALAKKQVFGICGIDALSGPTETVIVADESATPAWVAADLLAQAEHSGGTALLITPSRSLAEAVAAEVELQTRLLPEPNRADVLDSLMHRSGAVITQSLEEAVALADEFAPEHLCLSVRDPWAWVNHIHNAGGVFVGEHSYEVLGDYVAGPSHVMPTGGTARFASPLNVLDFLHVVNVVALDENTAHQLAPVAIRLAEAEGLHAHARAAQLRLT